MTAFADYLDLRTAVLEEAKRPDLADVFGRMTLLAEAGFNRKIRTVTQITDATVTFTAGVAPLPADFTEAIGLYNGYGCEYIQRPSQDVKPPSSRGYYAVQGSNLIAPNIEGDAALQYYAEIPTITTGPTASNWLLQRYPAIYLYGLSLEIAKHTRDADTATAMKVILADEIADMMADDAAIRYSRARVRIAGVTP